MFVDSIRDWGSREEKQSWSLLSRNWGPGTLLSLLRLDTDTDSKSAHQTRQTQTLTRFLTNPLISSPVLVKMSLPHSGLATILGWKSTWKNAMWSSVERIMVLCYSFISEQNKHTINIATLDWVFSAFCHCSSKVSVSCRSHRLYLYRYMYLHF